MSSDGEDLCFALATYVHTHELFTDMEPSDEFSEVTTASTSSSAACSTYVYNQKPLTKKTPRRHHAKRTKLAMSSPAAALSTATTASTSSTAATSSTVSIDKDFCFVSAPYTHQQKPLEFSHASYLYKKKKLFEEWKLTLWENASLSQEVSSASSAASEPISFDTVDMFVSCCTAVPHQNMPRVKPRQIQRYQPFRGIRRSSRLTTFNKRK